MNPLHDVFERRAREVGTPDLDIDMLVGRGEATLRRRRRTWASVGGAIAVVVAIAVVLAGGQTHSTQPKPAGPSPSIPDGQVLNPHPFLRYGDMPRNWGSGVRRPVASPPRLIECVDPRSWGAVITKSATWVSPKGTYGFGRGLRLNEFLLQYPDTSSAHLALLNAARQFRQCPTVVADPRPEAKIESGQHSTNWDEALVGQTGTAPGLDPQSVYALLIARAGNVLIVEEDTGIPTDRGECRLAIATEQALWHQRNAPSGCHL